RLQEVHVSHRLVITPKGRESLRRRDQAKCPWPGEIVSGPRAAEELTFPRHGPIPEVMLFECSPGSGMASQCRCIRVMAREPVGRRFINWAMVLGVKNRHLLPEAPLGLQSHDLTL